ncbi:T9SS type A sorting domain-containing protein [Patescibacteria group bacterium]|nr:MAG: T9SS type A sorting domain-containing protein [Patescibacteria group bacterium]
MKKVLFIIGIIVNSVIVSNAQVTDAMDFTMTDCGGTTHRLFADYLDSNEVVIMEYFMLCSSCATTGQRLNAMYLGLENQYPGMVHFLVFGYSDSYTCSGTINSWRNTNAPDAIGLDSGATQVSWYGGMGMPTVVVVGGTNHTVLYDNMNNASSFVDTTEIKTAIDNFFLTLGVDDANNNFQFSAYPNPTTNYLNIDLNLPTQSQTNIDMVDMTGRIVKKISNSLLNSGKHELQVETSDLPNGIYFIRVNSKGNTSQYKVSVKH